MSQAKKISNSFSEMKSIYTLSTIAMLLALRVVLGIFANGTLALFGNSIKISGAFLPIAITGAMFGPIPASLVGALGDILSFFMNPGTTSSYFPGFTISGLLTGFIYGMAFYKNKITIPRVIIGWVANMLIVETFLAAYWLVIIKGTPYTLELSFRFISVAIKCLPEILLIFGLGKFVSRIDIKSRASKRNSHR
jgi:ECF transporter S component (folate family)